MTMINAEFSSVLAGYMYEYLKECQLTHRSVGGTINYLNLFDKYLIKENVDKKEITEEIYDKWLNSFMKVNSDSTIRHKTLCIMAFLKYMKSLGVDCYVPHRAPRTKFDTFVPYIFTHDEIKSIFAVADAWRDKCMKPEGAAMVMPVAIRLLYSTGLRVSEMINLKNKDLNLKNHTLKVRTTKNWEERIAPVNDSLEKVIVQYVGHRDKLPMKGLDNPEGWLFVNHRGRKITMQTFLARFHKITQKAGIKGNNVKHGSRVHDLRHTACVHLMEKLQKEGYDLYDSIPIISAYMGHKSLFSTENYLRLSAEFYPNLIKYGNAANEPINRIIENGINYEEY